MTGAARAAVPIVAAVARTGPVAYAEVVASLAARSADHQARAGIDTYLENTCADIRSATGADAAKAVMVINPADPPVLTRYTVYCLVPGTRDTRVVERDILSAVHHVRCQAPGYRLARPVQFEAVGPLHLAQVGAFTGTRITTLLEVRAAAPLPEYAGDLYLTGMP